MRTRSRCASNPADLIEEVTKIALSTKHERLAIEILTLLVGVSWPTASVILHFCRKGTYPILDFRAIWSLHCDVPSQYNFDFWWRYTEFFRQLVRDTGESARTIDRALWQYSKENQGTTES